MDEKRFRCAWTQNQTLDFQWHLSYNTIELVIPRLFLDHRRCSGARLIGGEGVRLCRPKILGSSAIFGRFSNFWASQECPKIVSCTEKFVICPRSGGLQPPRPPTSYTYVDHWHVAYYPGDIYINVYDVQFLKLLDYWIWSNLLWIINSSWLFSYHSN